MTFKGVPKKVVTVATKVKARVVSEEGDSQEQRIRRGSRKPPGTYSQEQSLPGEGLLGTYLGETAPEHPPVSISLGLDVKDLLEHWENDQLKLAILDSWIHVFDLPEDLVRYHHVVPEDDPSHAFMGQTLVLSRANGYTYLHHDPYKYGGGWMYLHEGQKAWHYLDPKWMPYIFSDEDKNVQDLLPEDAGKLIPSELLDEVEFLTATAKAGDFLYWPPSWMHRVWTHEKSLGVGGYIRREEWPEHVNKLTKIL